MIIKDIMHSATVVEPDLTVFEAARLMRKKNIGSVLVNTPDGSWGVVTERDILNKVVAEDQSPVKLKVTDIMTDLQHTIDSCAPIEEAGQKFSSCPIRRLPVMEDGKIIGIITSRDVAKKRVSTHFRRKFEYSRLSSGHIR